MVKVTIALIVLACSAMMGQTHGSPMDEREAEFMRKYDGLTVHDRNLTTWKLEYAAKIAAYKAKLYESGTTNTVNQTEMCDNTQELREDITSLEIAIGNKESGLVSKNTQLGQLQAILDNPSFVAITGLKEVLQGYIDTHKTQNDADLVTLGTEKNEIRTLETQIDSYSCPCVFNDWGEWGALSADQCPVTCGGGMESRRRTVKRWPTNSGTPCSDLALGSYHQYADDGNYADRVSQDCNTNPCPVDCVWSSWDEWDMTAEHCYEKGCTEPCANRVPQPCDVGERVRKRTCSTDDCMGRHDGVDCDGNDYDKKDCNVLTEAQALVSQQENLITKIQECASDCGTHTDCGYDTVLPIKCG